MENASAENNQQVNNADQRGDFLLLLYAFTIAQNLNDHGGSFATDIHRYISRFYPRASLETTALNLDWLCRKSPVYMQREADGVDGGGDSARSGYKYSANRGLQPEQLLDLIITEDIADNLVTLDGFGEGPEVYSEVPENIDFTVSDDLDEEVEIVHFSEHGEVVIECDLATAERLLEDSRADCFNGVETVDDEVGSSVSDICHESSGDSIEYIDVASLGAELHYDEMFPITDCDAAATETLNQDASSLKLALQLTKESLYGYDLPSPEAFLEGPMTSEESSDDQEVERLTASEEDAI